MVFCVSCGKQIEDGSQFCEFCGAAQQAALAAPAAPAGSAVGGQRPASSPVEPVQSAVLGGGTQSAVTTAAAPAKPMPVWFKVVLIVAVVLAAIIFGTKTMLGKMHDPNKMVSEFKDTSVSIAEGKYTVDQSETPIKLLPGVYSAEASYTDPETGVKLESSYKKCEFTSTTNSLYVGFDYTGTYVQCDRSGMTLKALYIDGTKYGQEVSPDQFLYGFEVRPVKYDSEIRVVASAYGMEFEKTFKVSYGSCYFTLSADDLPESIQQEAMDIAKDVIVNVVKARGAYDRSAVQTLSARYGSTSQNFVNDVQQFVENRLSLSPAEMGWRAEFVKDPECSSAQMDSFYLNDDYISARVRVRFTMNYVEMSYGYWDVETDTYVEDWMRGEPINEERDGYVYMEFHDGAWMITSYSI